MEAAHKYWDEALQVQDETRLATDLPRPLAPSMEQHRLSCVVDSGVGHSLRAITRGCEFGVHEALLTVFLLWLHRMTRQDSITVGVLTTLRGDGFGSVLGPLSNRLPLCLNAVESAARGTFCGLQQWVSQFLLEMMKHRRCDLQEVKMGPSGPQTWPEAVDTQPDFAPLFRVMYMMESQLSGGGRQGPGSLVSDVSVIGTALAPYDLTLRVNQRWDGGMEFVFLYSAAFFSPAYVRELLGSYVQLVRHSASDPSVAGAAYSLVTPSAGKVLPDPAAPQDKSFPGGIASCFHQMAQRHPQALAVRYTGRPDLTYAELDAATSRLAQLLRRKGIGSGDVVGIYGHRSPAVVVAILALYKAGAAYSMMDPAYPAERVITCMRIAGISGWLRISDASAEPAELADFLAGLGLKAQLVVPQPGTPQFDSVVDGCPDVPPGVEPAADQTCVVTFTSGSTGVPKGVMGRHSSLTTMYPWMGERFGITEKDRFGMCSGIAHDPLQRDIFTPLFFGAPIFIPTQDTISTPGMLARYMRAEEITVCCFTPALGQILVTVDEEGFTMPALRLVFFVGDVLIKRDVLRLRALAPNCRIVNMFGTTETQRAVGYFDLPPGEPLEGLKEIIPVGQGMKDVQLLVLNPGGGLCGIGEAGEIYVRSPHMAKGYVGLPEQTALRFVPNPFTSGDPSDRMYRTGDLGFYRADGTVECVGRADDQVKVRGFRIELGEINAKLSRHPHAKENVTIVRQPPGSYDKVIISYVVPSAEAAREIAEEGEAARARLARSCRDFLKPRVPHYMVPSAVVILDRMPLTPNAKIDTKALPAPAAGEHDPEEEGEKLTPTEEQVRAIWQRLLGNRRASREESFFDLGGHSLLATMATLEIKKQLGVALPLNTLFACPTLAGCAAAVDAARGGRADQPAASDGRLGQEALGLPLPAAAPAGEAGDSTAAERRDIFITGATGFLGAYLVREALDQGQGAVHCGAVRSPDERTAKQRVLHALGTLGLRRDGDEERIKVYPGDLSQPRLGMSDLAWNAVRGACGVAINNGAFLHWLHSYQTLKAANVGGTCECLRLCVEGKSRPARMAHVSTTNVYDSPELQRRSAGRLMEDCDLGDGSDLVGGGYTQSKWVADRYCCRAQAGGLPVTCIRPGYITADSRSGAWGTDDFLCRLMKGCAQLGAYPELGAWCKLDASPVDYVAKAVVALALDPAAAVRNYNVVHPDPPPYTALFDALRRQGYELRGLPYAEWRGLLLSTVEAGTPNELAAIVSHFTPSWEEDMRARPVYDRTNVAAALQGRVPFPDVGESFDAAVAYFVSVGFLSAPPGGVRRQPAVRLAKGVIKRSSARSQ
eukprot:TRINITY_DN2813_c0_g2_i1.p1 TRINITY_DN2813_c0_g2~~TRINITY_DN2813_c0_g2_i1.p1  ORF type:complete len:1574 (+),score=501.35 TRINITY_DN2813_c0_g2_i1:709-4722(+)